MDPSDSHDVTLQPEAPSLREATACCLTPDSGLLMAESHSHGERG
jgi:hypothetical protein